MLSQPSHFSSVLCFRKDVYHVKVTYAQVHLKVLMHTTTTLVVEGCSLLSWPLYLREKEGLGGLITTPTTTTITLPCLTMIQNAVSSSCDDGCGLLYLILCFAINNRYVIYWERTTSLKLGRESVGDNYSDTNFPLQYINHLSPLHIAVESETLNLHNIRLWNTDCGVHNIH